MFVSTVVLWWLTCGLTVYVCVHSGVMVAYLYFKNSGKMDCKNEAGAGAILKVNCLRFAGVFSYRYLRSGHTHTHTHTQNTFFPSTVCTLSSKTHFPKLFLLADPFWFRKIITDPYMFAHVNIECPDDRCSKLKVYFTELGLGRY